MKTLRLIGIVLLSIFILICCSSINPVSDTSPHYSPQEKDLKKFLGQKVTITGKAVNAKLGALLAVRNGTDVWMDNLQNWPEGYYVYENENETKTVAVTGTLIERYDVPVYNPNDSIIRQGTSMPEGGDQSEASQRYLLKDYTWVIVD